ncbi:MAG: hypothetical protein Kow00107_05100 [Planctomycetota bacterium]
MRFIVLLTICVLGFAGIFWLTWDYSLVSNIRIADGPAHSVVAVEQLTLSHVFSRFQDNTDFYRFDKSDASFHDLNFAAMKVIGIFPRNGEYVVVFPDSYATYKLEKDTLQPAGKMYYFGEDVASGYSFTCEAAVEIGDEIVCFGTATQDKGGAIYSLEIADSASEPVRIHSTEKPIKVLEAATDGKNVLLVWLDGDDPKSLNFLMKEDMKELFGRKLTVQWHGYLPVIVDGKPCLLMIREDNTAIDLFDLRTGELSTKPYLTIEEPLDKITAFAWDGNSILLSDGVSLVMFERRGGVLVRSGANVKLGKAPLPPEIMMVAAQLLMLAVLLGFSLIVANRGKRTSRILQPANLVVRLSAFAVDGVLILALAVGVFVLVLLARGTPLVFHLLSSFELQLFQNLALGLLCLYGLVCELLISSTPGKALFRLSVIQLGNSKPSTVAIVVRNLMKPVDILLTSLLVTPIMMILTPMNQRLGDMLSSTVVVHGTSKEIEEIRRKIDESFKISRDESKFERHDS